MGNLLLKYQLTKKKEKYLEKTNFSSNPIYPSLLASLLASKTLQAKTDYLRIILNKTIKCMWIYGNI